MDRDVERFPVFLMQDFDRGQVLRFPRFGDGIFEHGDDAVPFRKRGVFVQFIAVKLQGRAVVNAALVLHDDADLALDEGDQPRDRAERIAVGDFLPRRIVDMDALLLRDDFCIGRSEVLVRKLGTDKGVAVFERRAHLRRFAVQERLDVDDDIDLLGRDDKGILLAVPVAAEDIAGYRPHLIFPRADRLCFRPLVRILRGILVADGREHRTRAVSGILTVRNGFYVGRHFVHQAVHAEKGPERGKHKGEQREYEDTEAPQRLQHFLYF